MRWLTMIALGSALAAPAMAQTGAPSTTPPTGALMATPPPPHRPMRTHPRAHTRPQARSQAGMRPGNAEDHGPFTPEANRAYDGGGAILQGAPGGPAPPASAVLTQPTGQPLPRAMPPR